MMKRMKMYRNGAVVVVSCGIFFGVTATVCAASLCEPRVITASDRQSSDFFGIDVDLDGDVMIVGADREDSRGSDAGAAGFRQVNNYLSCTFDSVDGITFYPELHSRGMIVHPRAWHPESSEPMLKVMTGRWLQVPPPENAVEIMEAATQELGWEWDHHHGSGGYIHVEHPDLEKIEGPPPDGAV